MKKMIVGAVLLFLGVGFIVGYNLSDEPNVQTVTENQEKITQSSPAASWAYPFVIWNKHTYRVTEQSVTEVGKELGQVTVHSDRETHYSREDNFSNQFLAGTKYYEITGIDPNTAIAVETNGGYVKAVVQEGK
jgi:hypothetical protein